MSTWSWDSYEVHGALDAATRAALDELRREAYTRVGKAPAGASMCDALDDAPHAVHLLWRAPNGGALVAAVRLLMPSVSAERFDIEDFVDLDGLLPRRTSVVEVSRMVVASSDVGTGAMVQVLTAVAFEVVARGRQWILVCADRKLAKVYLGMGCLDLGRPFAHAGLNDCPHVTLLGDLRSAVRGRVPAEWPYWAAFVAPATEALWPGQRALSLYGWERLWLAGRLLLARLTLRGRSRRRPRRSRALRGSANGVAALRAAAYLEETAHRHQDHLSVDLVTGFPGVLATTPVLRKLAWRAFNHVIPGIYGTHIARTRWLDDGVRAALDAGAQQLVILGAGLDSRAYRLAAEHHRVFEVDLPENQAQKRARVIAALGGVPPNVRYVSTDLGTKADVIGLLSRRGFDPQAPTVVLLEGVSMYLTLEAMDRTLSALAAAPGVRWFLFDGFHDDVVSRGGGSGWMRHHFRQMAKRGEPYTLGLSKPVVDGLAARHGFRAASWLSGAEVDEVCFPGGAGRPTVGFLCLARLER